VARRYVFDTGVLTLFAEGDPRVRPFIDEVRRGAAEGLVVDLSITEFQYKVCQSLGVKAAEHEGKRIRTSALRLVRNSPYLDLAWRFKCRYRNRFSLADCVLLAVAQVHVCRVLTTDSAFEHLGEPRISSHVLPIPGPGCPNP